MDSHRWLSGGTDRYLELALHDLKAVDSEKERPSEDQDLLQSLVGIGADTQISDSLVVDGSWTSPDAIAFFTGDLVAADHFVWTLLDLSTKNALAPWQAWGRGFEGMLLFKRGDTMTGLQRLSTAVSGLRDIGHAVYYVAFTGNLAEALGRAGQAAHGLATTDEALTRSERSEERWCVAKLQRLKGELVVLQGASGAKRVAEEHFRQSLDWARRQGALSWELRTATSLARLLREGLLRRRGQSTASVYDRFTEGFDTTDLVAAKGLLQELRTGSP